jgi:hypothetical protein
MSQWDKDLTWYNKLEYQRFEAFINISADRMIQGEPEQGPFCYRGIESDPQQAIRLQRCAHVVQIVLAEQERLRQQQQQQQQGTSKDGTTTPTVPNMEQALAHVYQVYSIPAQQYSQQMGTLDERAISTMTPHPKDDHGVVGSSSSSSSSSSGAVGTQPPPMPQQQQQQQEPPRRRIQKFNSMGHDGQERKRIQRFLSMGGGGGSNGAERKMKPTATASSSSTMNRSTSPDQLPSHPPGVVGGNTRSTTKPAVVPRISRFTMLTRSLSTHSGFSTLEEEEQ